MISGKEELREVRGATIPRTLMPKKLLGRLLAISLIAVVAVVTRVTAISAQSLWYDEGFFFIYTARPGFSAFIDTLRHTDASDALQPLYMLIAYAWVHAVGLTELTLRIPSVIFAIIFVAVAYWAIGHRWRPSTSSLFAAALAAGSAFSIYYGQEARPYALLQVLSMLLVGAWLRLRRSGGQDTRSSRIMLAGLSLLCSLAGIIAILYLAAISLSDLIMERKLKAWLGRWWLSMCASACVVVICGSLIQVSKIMGGTISRRREPLLINLAYSAYGLLFGPTMPPPQEQLRGVNRYAVVLSYWPVLVFVIAVIGCLLAGVYFNASTARTNSRSVIRSLTLLIFLYSGFLIVFAFATSLNFQPRHASMLLAPIILVMAVCAAEQAEHPSAGSFALLTWFSLAGWLALNSFSFYNYRFNPEYGKDAYREVVAMLDPRDRTILLWGNSDLLRFYGAPPLVDAHKIEPGKLSGFIGERAGVKDSVTLILNRPFYWFNGADPASAISNRYSCHVSHLPYFALFKCTAKGSNP
jgi:uncharacterized membrane protein